MNWVKLLEQLESGGSLLKRIGLRRLSRLGREVVRRLCQNQLCVDWEGFLIMGGIEHRGYLAALRRRKRESGALQLWRQLIPRNGIVVDVGAYLGIYSLVGARLAGGGGCVLSLEVDPRTIPFLRRNLEQNGLAHSARLLESAAADRSGVGEFFLNASDPSGSSLLLGRPGAFRLQVPIVRLDDVLADLPRVDAMKIDVEGAEPKVLRGATDLLARSPNVAIICEVNPRALAAGGSSADDLVRLIEEFGFQVHEIHEPSGKLVQLPSCWEAIKYVNVLAQRASSEGRVAG